MSPGWQDTQITDGSQLSGTKVRIHCDETLFLSACFLFSSPRGQRPPFRSHLLSLPPPPSRSQLVRVIIFYIFFFLPFPSHLHSPPRRRLLFEPPLSRLGANPSARLAVFAVKSTWSLSLNPAGAQHLVVMDLDMWLGTMLRTEGSGEEEEGRWEGREGRSERKHSLQLSMKHICQLHDIQTDGESLTLCCKHGALLKFLCLLISLAASPYPTCHGDNVTCEPPPHSPPAPCLWGLWWVTFDL